MSKSGSPRPSGRIYKDVAAFLPHPKPGMGREGNAEHIVIEVDDG
jgi:hypothetical protein